jgi:ketosteroid isomerase-like protein
MNQPSHIEVDSMNTQPSRTSEVIDRFNQAFQRHDGSLLKDLIAEDCVMESVDPAPDGTRVVGRAANLRFFGPGLSQSVRGVTLMHLRDGLIVEALAYAKSGDAAVGAAVRNASGSESR